MAKKLIRLTEGDLHRIIKESVNNILKRNLHFPNSYGMLMYEIENGDYDEIIQSNECDEWAERMISK